MNDYRKDVTEGLIEARWTVWKAFVVLGIPIILLLLVAGGIRCACSVVSTPIDIVKKTMDADNVLYNYEWFKQRAEDLDAAVLRIEITEGAVADLKEELPKERKDWSYDDKQEINRLRTDLRGQKAHYETLSAEFQARSKMANRRIFKSDNRIISWVDKLAGVKEE